MKTKTCPRCGQSVFDDMDVCYECLYEFVEEPGNDVGGELFLHLATSSVDAFVPVPKDGLIIGRGSACDVILHTPAVSRRHVQVIPCGNALRIKNLGARNMPTIDNKSIGESAFLKEGSVLNICGATFRLQSSKGEVQPR